MSISLWHSDDDDDDGWDTRVDDDDDDDDDDSFNNDDNGSRVVVVILLYSFNTPNGSFWHRFLIVFKWTAWWVVGLVMIMLLKTKKHAWWYLCSGSSILLSLLHFLLSIPLRNDTITSFVNIIETHINGHDKSLYDDDDDDDDDDGDGVIVDSRCI